MFAQLRPSLRFVPTSRVLARTRQGCSTRNLSLSFFGTREPNSREITDSIEQSTEGLFRDVLLPLNAQTHGPLEKGSHKRTPLPFVFLLGNHSSGKSTFVNHVLGRSVQEAGVAPTDDGFTIIAPGPRDIDQDGPSLVGDPDMGFASLRTYGPSLVHHVKLKVRTDLDLQEVMLVDSPGMIDSPNDSITYKKKNSRSDRGYDFEGAAKWFAERADVILLFFDPDKPGTTGETLSVLTNSLAGMEHKLHIILNKVDQFEKIHDFARAYGSLCWNLSKVIPRKDLPRIYTMCTPTEGGIRETSVWKTSVADIDATRAKVIEEVMRAPERRIDNMITQIDDSARILHMHTVMMENVRKIYQEQRWKMLTVTGALATVGNSFAFAALWAFPSIWGFSATLSLSSLAGASGIYLYGTRQLENLCLDLERDSELDGIFKKQYIRELTDKDEHTRAMWARVLPHLKGAIHTVGVPNLKRTSNSDLNQLADVIEVQVPSLRRVAAPLYRQRIDEQAPAGIA